MAKSTAPEVVSLSSAQVEELLVKLAPLLPAETYRLVEKLLRTLQWLMGAIQAKETTLGRLARMIFGAKRVQVSHPQLRPGDPCPDCKQGKLYLLKRPAQGVRLPASTQWELMAKAAPALEPVQEALVTLAAQGHLIHHDDTTLRVQSLAKESGAATPGKERTGIFTTSLLSEVEGHRIAL